MARVHGDDFGVKSRRQIHDDGAALLPLSLDASCLSRNGLFGMLLNAIASHAPLLSEL
jgi:hypothetical protein